MVITEDGCRILLALAQFQPNLQIYGSQRGRIASICAAGGVNWRFLSDVYGPLSWALLRLRVCDEKKKREEKRGLQKFNYSPRSIGGWDRTFGGLSPHKSPHKLWGHNRIQTRQYIPIHLIFVPSKCPLSAHKRSITAILRYLKGPKVRLSRGLPPDPPDP